MVDVRKICIYFITVLVGSSFLYQPLHARLHIHTVPYQPDIIYLGRQNHFEIGSYPSEGKNPASQDIFAEVNDMYANITGAYLKYHINNNKTQLPINMTLIYGNPTNGTWKAEIPFQSKVKMPYTVNYISFFKDHLNYSNNKPGPYYNPMDYNGKDEQIKAEQGYKVLAHYFLREPQESNLNTISITTHVSHVDVGNGTVNIQIRLNGRFINSTYLTIPPSVIQSQKGNEDNLKIQLTDIAKYKTIEDSFDIPASFHNDTRSYNSIPSGSFHAVIGRIGSTDFSSGVNVPISAGTADQLAFPLDHYSVDLIIKIPLKPYNLNHQGVKIQSYNQTFGVSYNSTWNVERTPPPESLLLTVPEIQKQYRNVDCSD